MAPQRICPTSSGWARGKKEWVMRSVKQEWGSCWAACKAANSTKVFFKTKYPEFYGSSIILPLAGAIFCARSISRQTPMVAGQKSMIISKKKPQKDLKGTSQRTPTCGAFVRVWKVSRNRSAFGFWCRYPRTGRFSSKRGQIDEKTDGQTLNYTYVMRVFIAGTCELDYSIPQVVLKAPGHFIR